jgi:hypothetical protein
MTVDSVAIPERMPIHSRGVNLSLVLRRLDGLKEEEYPHHLSYIWRGKGDPHEYFLQLCPTRLTVHAELQLVRFYDENPQRIPPFRFIVVNQGVRIKHIMCGNSEPLHGVKILNWEGVSIVIFFSGAP